MIKQNTHQILMIEPVAFGYNAETAKNNYFQHNDSSATTEIQATALAEFKAMCSLLKQKGVQPLVLRDSLNPHTPDSIFPNNWISFHHDASIALYPMFAPNRRAERRSHIIDELAQHGFKCLKIVDLTESEHVGKYLEGTGSMVLDRTHQKSYACLSQRTDTDVLNHFCDAFHFEPITFQAFQTVEGKRLPIYHTNVMMSIGENFAVICTASIDQEHERQTVLNTLVADGKEIIDISEAQMHHFAGNLLQIENATGNKLIALSQTAYESLTQEQIKQLQKHGELLPIAIPTIEKYGGGSVRCMMAELFLPQHNS